MPWTFRGDPEAARPLLRRALALDPRHPRATRESAMLLRMKNDLDAMHPYMEAALAREPAVGEAAALGAVRREDRDAVGVEDRGYGTRTKTHWYRYQRMGPWVSRAER